MKSFNVMLLFAAVSTAYAVVEDTRPGTACKTMPANEEECRDFAKATPSGSYDTLADHNTGFYGHNDNYPSGCVHFKWSFMGMTGGTVLWNEMSTDIRCGDSTRIDCTCLEGVLEEKTAVADVRPGTKCKTMPANEEECKTRTEGFEGYRFMGSIAAHGDPYGCVSGNSEGKMQRGPDLKWAFWNSFKGDDESSCEIHQFTKYGGTCTCVEEKSSDGVASKEAPKVEAPKEAPKVEAPKVDAAKMPTWGSKAPEEITFTLDMFTKQCNPKECENWTCVDWCHCFESNPLVEQMFNSVAYGPALAGLCPSDATPCQC